MITVPSGVRVLVATKPVDFRKGGEGLAALVREHLGHLRWHDAVERFATRSAC